MLAIYLNDHLAGATAALELVRRSTSNNRESGYGPFLEGLSTQIEEDRDALLDIMGNLDVGVDRLKVAGGWAAEKAGRLKLNGRVCGYSPLSRVVELEVLLLGIRGKLALWVALSELEPHEPRLDATALALLIGRAEAQLDGVEEERRRAVAEAFVAAG